MFIWSQEYSSSYGTFGAGSHGLPREATAKNLRGLDSATFPPASFIGLPEATLHKAILLHYHIILYSNTIIWYDLMLYDMLYY